MYSSLGGIYPALVSKVVNRYYRRLAIKDSKNLIKEYREVRIIESL